MKDTGAKVYVEWRAFEAFRKKHPRQLRANPWVGFRGEARFGPFPDFASCADELKRTRGKDEPLGAIFHRSDEPIRLMVALGGN